MRQSEEDASTCMLFSFIELARSALVKRIGSLTPYLLDLWGGTARRLPPRSHGGRSFFRPYQVRTCVHSAAVLASKLYGTIRSVLEGASLSRTRVPWFGSHPSPVQPPDLDAVGNFVA